MICAEGGGGGTDPAPDPAPTRGGEILGSLSASYSLPLLASQTGGVSGARSTSGRFLCEQSELSSSGLQRSGRVGTAK